MSPVVDMLPVVASAENDVPHQTEKPYSTAKMDAFFNLREEHTARLKENETAERRTLRLSREGQHPTVSARVFEWTPNGDGEFVHEEILTKPRRKAVLDDYRGKQRRYNAVLNEWHVCVLWESFDDSDDEDDYVPPIFEGDYNTPNSSTNMQTHDSDMYSDDIWKPNQVCELGNREALQLQTEILQVAALYFGYTERQHKKICRDFGLIWDQVAPVREALEYPAVAAVIDFFKRLAGDGNLSSDEWDLSDKNQQPVRHSPRFKFFRPVFPKRTGETKEDHPLYMLDLGSQARAP